MMGIRGRKILITRDKDSDDELSRLLNEAGAEIIFFPTIKISDIEDHNELDRIFAGIDKYDGIFFTSANAVKYFFARAKMLNVVFGGKIYSVGEKTKQKIESYGFSNIYIPAVFSAEELMRSLSPNELKGKSFLFPRGNLSMEKLQNGISKYADVDEVIVYNNGLPSDEEPGNKEEICSMLMDGSINCVTYFSPSSIKNFILLFPGFRQNDIKIAVIGKTTLQQATEFGLNVDIVPEESTSRSMAIAIIEYFNKGIKC